MRAARATAALTLALALVPAAGADAVVGGRVALPSELPAVAAILDTRPARDGSPRPDAEAQVCGGTLIAPAVVLTAAHCIVDVVAGRDLAPATRRVILGRTDLRSGGGEVREVAAIARHPWFRVDPVLYDVALIRLAAPASPGPAAIAPLGLRLREGVAGTVAGWGLTGELGPDSPVLRTARLPLWSNARCARAYPRDHEPDLMLCAASPRGRRDVCRGDSGGPLLVGGLVVGVTSFGLGCGRPRYPTNFAWAASPLLRAWITRRASALDRGDPDAVTPRIAALRLEAGGVVRYELSEPAEVVLTVRRRAGRSWRSLSPALVHAGRAGANGLRLPAWVRRLASSRRTFDLRAVATDGAGLLSAPARVALRRRLLSASPSR